MTGRLVLDGVAPIERLNYSSRRDEARWDRLRIELTDGGVLRVNDPRRWARFSIDPDVAPLGPDLFDVTRAELTAVLRRRRTALKAVLLDQHAIAGLGNMLVDELLWHSGLDPRRIANTVTTRQVGTSARGDDWSTCRRCSNVGAVTPECCRPTSVRPARHARATAGRFESRQSAGARRCGAPTIRGDLPHSSIRRCLSSRSPLDPAAALVAVGDPGRDRTVYATIVLLVALGFAMIMLAVWLLRNTRPDPEVLAPLERMGQRKWRRADPGVATAPSRRGAARRCRSVGAVERATRHGRRVRTRPAADRLRRSRRSSTTAVAVPVGLPAPSAGAVPLDGPVGVDADADGVATPTTSARRGRRPTA